MKKRKLPLPSRRLLTILLALAAIGALLLYRLGSLPGGIAASELKTAVTPLGWHGLVNHPLYFPADLLRSIVYFFFGHDSAFWVRLPSIFFGAAAMVAFAGLIYAWHGLRTATLAVLLFVTSAWVLHVSRIATMDVLYLSALPLLLGLHVVLQDEDSHPLWLYAAALIWGLLATIPGLIWLLLLEVFLQREAIADGWRHFRRIWQRLLLLLIGLWWLPLLVKQFHSLELLKQWVGLPASFGSPLHVAKGFAGVLVHVFVRGPQYPHLWLGRSPLLDVFTLVCAIIGIYFYATRRQAQRSRLLAAFGLISFILVGLGGPVGLSLVVPLMYVMAATGIAYLLHAWLKIFPFNPLARGLGIGLVTVAVCLSVVYNLRAYFVAWPHNEATSAAFRYRP